MGGDLEEGRGNAANLVKVAVADAYASLIAGDIAAVHGVIVVSFDRCIACQEGVQPRAESDASSRPSMFPAMESSIRIVVASTNDYTRSVASKTTINC